MGNSSSCPVNRDKFTKYARFLRQLIDAKTKLWSQINAMQALPSNLPKKRNSTIMLEPSAPLLDRLLVAVWRLLPQDNLMAMNLDWVKRECWAQVEFAVKAEQYIGASAFYDDCRKYSDFLTFVQKHPGHAVVPNTPADVMFRAHMIYDPEGFPKYCHRRFRRLLSYAENMTAAQSASSSNLSQTGPTPAVAPPNASVFVVNASAQGGLDAAPQSYPPSYAAAVGGSGK